MSEPIDRQVCFLYAIVDLHRRKDAFLDRITTSMNEMPEVTNYPNLSMLKQALQKLLRAKYKGDMRAVACSGSYSLVHNLTLGEFKLANKFRRRMGLPKLGPEFMGRRSRKEYRESLDDAGSTLPQNNGEFVTVSRHPVASIHRAPGRVTVNVEKPSISFMEPPTPPPRPPPRSLEAENASLDHQLQSLQAELRNSKSELQKSKAELQKSKAENASKEHTIYTLTDQLKKEKQRITPLVRELTKSNPHVSSMLYDLFQRDRRREELEYLVRATFGSVHAKEFPRVPSINESCEDWKNLQELVKERWEIDQDIFPRLKVHDLLRAYLDALFPGRTKEGDCAEVLRIPPWMLIRAWTARLLCKWVFSSSFPDVFCGNLRPLERIYTALKTAGM